MSDHERQPRPTQGKAPEATTTDLIERPPTPHQPTAPTTQTGILDIRSAGVRQQARGFGVGRAQVATPPKYNVSGAECIDVDPDDGTETHFFGDYRFPCPKCPGDKHHWHSCFVEIGAGPIITMQAVRVCRDCETEFPGEVSEVGRVEGADAASKAIGDFAKRAGHRS